jgi:hypothetical protein
MSDRSLSSAPEAFLGLSLFTFDGPKHPEIKQAKKEAARKVMCLLLITVS